MKRLIEEGMPAISRVSSAKGSAKGSVGGSLVESAPSTVVDKLSSCTASLTPVSVTGRVIFLSGIAKTYPAMRVTIKDKSGSLSILASSATGLHGLGIDDIVRFERITVRAAYRGSGLEGHYEPAGAQHETVKRRRSGGGQWLGCNCRDVYGSPCCLCNGPWCETWDVAETENTSCM